MKNKSHILFKNSSNITGLSKKYNEEEIDKKKQPIKNLKSLKKKFYIYNIRDKVDSIKDLLNKPTEKLPYDGFAIQGNKFTTESLLQKSCEKEKISIFERNKLCKNNYPLIKFLSNRKTKNNSKKLLIEILSNDYGELTKAQENIIKYEKYKSKTEKQSIKEYILKDKSQNKLFKENEHYLNNKLNNYYNFLKNKEIKDKLYSTQKNHKNTEYTNFKSKMISKSLKKAIYYINNRPETQRIYTNLGFGETVRLDNHAASIKNNEILLNRFIRKKYLNLKREGPDFINNEIINDISKLKFHNKIMPLNTKVLTI